MNCVTCCNGIAKIRRPSTAEPLCLTCFYEQFENQVCRTVENLKLFKAGQRVAIAISGGKDSIVLAHLMNLLNVRQAWDLDLHLLAIDEGIKGYRDDSLAAVQRTAEKYNLPLTIVSHEDLFGWTMDNVVRKVGVRNSCTFCGVFRRQALERGAQQLKADVIALGHNADDAAETVLMNILRGDIARFDRCLGVATGDVDSIAVQRVKPLMFVYEKEIVLYAYFKKLDYFSTECTYSTEAFRGHARMFIKELERSDSTMIAGILLGVQSLTVNDQSVITTAKSCKTCGMMASKDLCNACVLLEKLGPPPVSRGCHPTYETDEAS